MSNNHENRVLNRMGARQLSQNELGGVGGFIPTLLSVIFTNNGQDHTLDS